MKSIDKLKNQYMETYAKKCCNKKVDELTLFENQKVKEIAEMGAYIDSVIPDGFENYTIFDFNGYAINKKDNTKTITIPRNIARRARDMICKYCWGLSWKEVYDQKKIYAQNDNSKEKMTKYLRLNSKMMERYKNGQNIIIYGESKRPIGRTMLSSVVMKEAFRLRFTKHHTIGQSYDWVDFAKLMREIERSRLEGKDGKEDTEDLTDYKTCDWLVVDNIQKKMRSEKQNTLYSYLLDSFFIGRYERELPTILVFKFDIRDKLFDFEKAYGTGLSRILESNRTLKIPLSDNLLNSSDYE